MMTESSFPATMPPLHLRNLLASVFMYADKPLIYLSAKYKLLDLLRCILLFLLRFLLYLFPFFISSGDENHDHPLKPTKGGDDYHLQPKLGGREAGDTGIGRALSHLLSLVNDVPVSSRKYEVVRSLAEKLVDENLAEGNESLREINCSVLTAAFSRTLNRLQAAVLDQGRGGGIDDVTVRTCDDYFDWLSRFLRGVKYCGVVLWRRGKRTGVLGCDGSSAEKLAVELLWLARKMEACGCADQVVFKWASASNLAWLALSAEPRLQGSLVKISAFVFKQAQDIRGEDDEEGRNLRVRQTKMRLLMSWLPLLCRGSNGIEAPVLSVTERAELENILEEMIDKLGKEEEQEQVLSLWLHHFTYCASSDWPNLQKCYTRWCNASRRALLLHS